MPSAEYMREYRKRPDVKNKIKEYNKKKHKERWSSFTTEEKREWNAKKLYGVSYKEIESKYLEQDKKCACCKTEKPIDTLVIDHCHSSGINRGLLCHSCNKLIGFAYEDIEILINTIKYLETWNGR